MSKKEKLPYLSAARRKMISHLLAHQIPKSQIAKRLRVGQSTLYRWCNEDPELEEAAKKLAEQKYQQAIERLDEIAFETAIKPTAETQLKALLRIIEGYEADARRQAGQVTKDGMVVVLLNICRVLVDMPEARMRILAAFSESRDEAGISDIGSGLVPSAAPENEPHGAGPMAKERSEDHDT